MFMPKRLATNISGRNTKVIQLRRFILRFMDVDF
jgi:hypothetical protein